MNESFLKDFPRAGKARRGGRGGPGVRDPYLKLALELARERFAGFGGVLGIGVGRPYSESKGRYLSETRLGRELGIKVCVREKLRFDDRGGGRSGRKRPRAANKAERLPKWMVVKPKGMPGRRVMIDVVSFGEGRLFEGRGLPTAGVIRAGRLFAHAWDPASEVGPRLDGARTSIGTIGAVVVGRSGTRYAVTAGHVFTDYCNGGTQTPPGTRAVGVDGTAWVPLSGAEISPAQLLVNDVLVDGAVFAVPKRIEHQGRGVPKDFLGRLATAAEHEAALAASGATGFVWVERDGGCCPIKVDLDAWFPTLPVSLACASRRREFYPLTWRCRFVGEDAFTIGGDSGSGVYLDVGAGRSVLLGFHFMESKYAGQAEVEGLASFCLDARTLLREVFGPAAVNQGLEFE